MIRVLIVDDNEQNLYYLRTLLGGNGYAVESAHHGAEALVMARKSPPDVVISDLLMPVMDGYTLLRHWKGDARLTNIPFIVYTATYTDAEDERLAMDLGADAFILKPTEPEDFIARLCAVQANAGAAKSALPHQPVGDENMLLKYYSETLIRKLEGKTLQLEEANRALQLELAERRAIEEELNFKNRILQTQQETSLDAILVVGENGEVLTFNRKLIELWRFPAQIIGTHVDALVLPFAAGQTEDPEAFIAKVGYLYAHRDEESHDELQLKDGRIVDRYSAPITGEDGKYYGRIWYFRDITERKRAKAALETSEQEQREMAGLLAIERSRLLEAQRIAKVGSWETHLPSMAIIWSDQTYRIFEIDPRQFQATYQAFLELVHPQDREQVDQAFIKTIAQSSPGSIEHRLLMPDGRIKFLEENWQVFFDDQGQAVKAIGTCQDISERKAGEIRINYLNRVQAMLSSINTLIVRVQDRDELFRGACRIAVEKGGFSMALLVVLDPGMKKVVSIVSEGKDRELMSGINELLSAEMGVSDTLIAAAVREKRAIVSNDSQNDPRVLLGRKYTEAGVRSLIIFPLMIEHEAVGAFALYSSQVDFFHQDEIRLLTELADDVAFAVDHLEKLQKLNYLAYYDALTGLANRSLFLERFEQLIRNADNGHRIAVFLIDLERFKNFNDSFGQSVGDMLLKQVAEWLTDFAGDADLVARIDADHFAAVMPAVKPDGNLAHLIENALASLLENPFQMNDTKFRISAKIGTAIFPEDGTDAEVLFKSAEAALKMAKKSGSRHLFYTKKMTEAVAAKLVLENQLRLAIDNEEFLLYYQPKVSLLSGKITGAEALIRWNDPRTGLVPPSKFIPILEETGLIYEVGRWALRQAIADYLRWRAVGLEAVRISVNVSPLQLRNPGFAAEIERKISIGPHAAEGLELEITESMIIEDMQRNVATLSKIRDMGIPIAIDDFGTGFSSLSYLSKLPVDTIKIDRSFVISMNENPEGLALVSTIIQLAHALKLKVVAEGVETEVQSSLLRLLNCDEMQGYLFSEPVPVDDFEKKFLAP